MNNLLETQAWIELENLFSDVKEQHMREMFAAETGRVARFTESACGLNIDYSKNIISSQIMDGLINLAKERDVETVRNSMFSGDKINATEDRSVLHTALRNRSGKPVYLDGKDIMPEVKATLTKMESFVEKIHTGVHTGYTGQGIKHIVAIGIGGSYLGPKIMTESLKPYQNDNVQVNFIANVDGCHINDVLCTLNHEETLVVMSSKSFTTQETLQNTLAARKWFFASGGSQKDVAKHFVAVSSNVKAAVEFGIAEDNVFPMWDWVGGRYSLWSAIGLPIALALGFEHFEAMLEGAFDMDEHFFNTPLEKNLPVILAVLGIWYRHFFDAQSQVLLPYYHYLRGLPAYIQQLDMESNGKLTSKEGKSLEYPTGPIIWGSEGTNGQHSFHQLIHQGAGCMPIDFLFPLTAEKSDATHHAMLASNCFGQAQALMQGKTFEECYADLQNLQDNDAIRVSLAQHKTMPGNKPSNMITFKKLDPSTLGALIAMYEHKIHVQGTIWNVNSYDQWGVELGKQLGNKVLDGINGNCSLDDFDQSTAELISLFKSVN